MRVFLSNIHFLSPKVQSHRERTSIGALLNMISCPRNGSTSIAYSLAIIFILLSPVTGAGYAFDSASCSPEAIQYINLQMRRAVTISVNTVTVLNQGGLRVPTAIMDRIGDLMGVNNPIGYIKAVLTGGQMPGTNGRLQQISGIASYTQLLPNFDSSAPPATNGADAQGNLVLIPATPCVLYSLSHTLTCIVAHFL